MMSGSCILDHARAMTYIRTESQPEGKNRRGRGGTAVLLAVQRFDAKDNAPQDMCITCQTWASDRYRQHSGGLRAGGAP